MTATTETITLENQAQALADAITWDELKDIAPHLSGPTEDALHYLLLEAGQNYLAHELDIFHTEANMTH